MEKIVQLLKEKNQHLEAFRQLNQEEMGQFNDGNFDNLERFYYSREVLLDMIRVIDSMIEEAQTKVDPMIPIVDDLKKEMLRAFNNKNDMITEILGQDLQILSAIENAKSGIIRELSQVRAGRKAIKAYKSGNPTKRLNEEA